MNWLAQILHRLHLRYVSLPELLRRRRKLVRASRVLAQLRARQEARARIDAYLGLVNEEMERRDLKRARRTA